MARKEQYIFHKGSGHREDASIWEEGRPRPRVGEIVMGQCGVDGGQPEMVIGNYGDGKVRLKILLLLVLGFF